MLFACGDVMSGRGVDQILPHPGDPRLREAYITDAREYVRLAERASGPIPRPAGFDWPWGDALPVLEAMAPDARVINLETSITRRGDFAPGKAVHYRMSPRNVPLLTAVRPDVCALANNHVLDFGPAGLRDTLDALARAGLTAAGAGRDEAESARPAAVPLPGGGRMLVLACGSVSSGIPPSWAATRRRPGVYLLPDASGASGVPGMSGVSGVPGLSGADALIARAESVRAEQDLVVVSIHWGSNWGYEVPEEQVRFAHRLIDGGIDLVHGHSSHHPRPIEVYRGKLILYGCGDCVDDYEGISGYETFRSDLRLLYFASMAPGSGVLESLLMVPVRSAMMRLRRAGIADSRWLTETLSWISGRFGTRFECARDGTIELTG